MKTAQSTCMPIYSPNFRVKTWGREGLSVAKDIAQVLGVEMTHVCCSHSLGEKAPLRDRQNYRWNHRNRDKLDALLGVTVPIAMFLTLATSARSYPLVSIDILEGQPYCIFYVECSDEICDVRLPFEYFSQYVEILSRVNRLCDALYGFVTQMRINSLPAIHFTTDWEAPNMTPEENENSNVWYEQRVEYWCKVRGVYWGNLLSAAHLAPLGGAAKFSQDVAAIVGSDLVARIDENKVFFMLPDIADSRGAVEDLLAQADLLMCTTNHLV